MSNTNSELVLSSERGAGIQPLYLQPLLPTAGEHVRYMFSYICHVWKILNFKSLETGGRTECAREGRGWAPVRPAAQLMLEKGLGRDGGHGCTML